MTMHTHRWTAVTAALSALVLAASAAGVWAQDGDGDDSDHGRNVVPLKDARLKIEFNATDQDAGVQVFIDSDPWKMMDIYDPSGRLIYRAINRGKLAKQGGTELFFESGEPKLSEVPLAEFLKRFPAGNYRMLGRGLNGEKFVGTAKFTHNIPTGPVLVSPLATVVDPNHTVVRWQPVASANGSPIIGYQVLVVKPNTGLAALPKIILDVMMPPTATSMPVPAGFLLPNSEYEWEVLAIEQGGNQTLSSSSFRTP